MSRSCQHAYPLIFVVLDTNESCWKENLEYGTEHCLSSFEVLGSFMAVWAITLSSGSRLVAWWSQMKHQYCMIDAYGNPRLQFSSFLISEFSDFPDFSVIVYFVSVLESFVPITIWPRSYCRCCKLHWAVHAAKLLSWLGKRCYAVVMEMHLFASGASKKIVCDNV